MAVTSIGSPVGPSKTTCGYCSPPGKRSAHRSSYHSAGLDARLLSCEVYQKMIDRGWRRSGEYRTWCYKPDLRMSCCPQYTIRLDALTFKPSKSHRKLLNRYARCRLTLKSKVPHAFSLNTAVHAAETRFYDGEKSPKHQFETSLEPSSYTPEKYNLYNKYQALIHSDDKSSPSGFTRFLVDSPLRTNPIPYPSAPPIHLPHNYGSYHQLYRLDGQLVALAVLDILPGCVSSVYFIYDKIWEEFSLGKLSALREISLAREMQEAGAPQMASLYMGFYIHSCQKMRYKGEYSPSYLADPETYEWFPLTTCVMGLEMYRYACFSHPEHSVTDLPSYLEGR
ncbi:arginine-tRNA-protein transferase [Collybia nuda]|uniref:arginyltransferase n=1 Tax=Collybia nuda TaxID=64659 RepID=A0A9P5YI66_9AGAR|nr:arginine-tRNA-protein transferase [Collybia nuda]